VLITEELDLMFRITLLVSFTDSAIRCKTSVPVLHWLVVANKIWYKNHFKK